MGFCKASSVRNQCNLSLEVRARADVGELVGDGKSFLESLLFLIYADSGPMTVLTQVHK